MFTQKLKSPYMESPVGASSGFFRPEYAPYNPQWETSGPPVPETHSLYEHEHYSAMSRVYNHAEDKPMLLSPLLPEQFTRMDMFTPDMKPHPRLDDLELQVLSSAPSELSSWSESEEKPNLVKYDSESSLEHLQSITFSPEQYSGARLNFNMPPEAAYSHDGFAVMGSGHSDAYNGGWADHAHMDLAEMVEGVFPATIPSRADQRLRKAPYGPDYNKENLQNMPVNLRNAISASHRVFRPTLDITAGNRPQGKMSNLRRKDKENETPPAESFMLNPWPVNDNAAGPSSQGQDSPVLRVPLPCLSATDRWKKHSEAYEAEPKVSGDMVCTHCDQTFKEVDSYIAHLDAEKVVHDNFCPDETCAFAALGFRYRWLLRRHICNHHLKDYNNKKLRKGAGSIAAKTALTENFLSHVYVCKKKNCLRAFYRSDSLSRHEKLIHAVGTKSKRKERLKLGKCDPKIFE